MAEFQVSSMFDVTGRSVVITGGANGLGRIIAKGFLVNGASVTLVDILKTDLDDTERELALLKKHLKLRGVIRSIHGDVSSREGIEAIVNTIRGYGMDVDTLILAAGIRRCNTKAYVPGQGLDSLVEATRSMAWADLEASFQVNLFAQYYLVAGLLDLIGASAAKESGRGSIICFSSVASKHTAQFVPAYQTSKAAVDHLVKIMAAEFADHYIRVNAISPGLFACSMNPIDPHHPLSNMRFARETPARRPGSEQEIAATALYLASRAGAYINGQNIRVDGGRLLVAARRMHVDCEYVDLSR